MLIGVLALQGAFREHMRSLEKIGVQGKLVKSNDDLEGLDGLILPGGESTAMGKLLIEFQMKENLAEKIKNGLPVWGTCAGMILLANDIGNENPHLEVIDIEVVRNGYGRQLGSFETTDRFADKENVPMVFIRAPYINKIGDNVKVLSVVDDRIVAAERENVLVTSFHPELTEDTTILEYFVSNIG